MGWVSPHARNINGCVPRRMGRNPRRDEEEAKLHVENSSGGLGQRKPQLLPTVTSVGFHEVIP